MSHQPERQPALRTLSQPVSRRHRLSRIGLTLSSLLLINTLFFRFHCARDPYTRATRHANVSPYVILVHTNCHTNRRANAAVSFRLRGAGWSRLGGLNLWQSVAG